MKNILRLSLVVLVIAGSACFAQTKLPKTAKFLPKDSVIVFNIEDYAALQKSFEGSNFYKFWNDPAMKPFVEKFNKACDSKMQGGQQEYLIEIFKDPNSFPQGRIAFAFVTGENALKGEEAGGIGVFEFGKNIDKAKEAVDTLVKKAIEKGAVRKKQNVSGIEVTTLLIEREDPNTADQSNANDAVDATKRLPFELNYCFLDDALILSADTDFNVMTFLLSQIQGKNVGPVLSDEPDYVSVMQAVNLENSAEIFINIKTIINTITKKDTTGQTASQLEIMGLGNISCLGLKINASEKAGDNFNARAMLKVNGPKKGLLKMFEFNKSAITVPNFVDNTASYFKVINWDINKAYRQLVETMTAVEPQMAMYLNMPFPSPDGKKMMTIQEDVLAYLGSEVVITQSYDETASMENAPSSVVAIAVNNQAKLDESLGTLHSMIFATADPSLKREFLGHSIYLMDLQNSQFFGGGVPDEGISEEKPEEQVDAIEPSQSKNAAPKIGFTVTDTHLIIASEKDLEKTLRLLANKNAPKLQTEKWFTFARAKLPASVGTAGIVNMQKTYEILWKQLKANGQSAIAPDMNNAELSSFFDFSLLPDFDKVKQYFGIEAGYCNSVDDGFYCETKTVDMPK